MGKRSKLFLFLGGAGILSALLFFVFLSKNTENTPQTILAEKSQQNLSPLASPSIPAVAASTLNDDERAKLQLLDDILKSKNDNDPRIDHELRGLSTAMKHALYKRYDALAREDRNGRGLIVFLIAREIRSAEDIQFLQSIYEEPPCTNMDGCSAAPSNDPHHSGVENTSLNYPQLVGLYQIDKAIRENPAAFMKPEMNAALQELLRRAKLFPVQSVQTRAAAISTLLSKP